MVRTLCILAIVFVAGCSSIGPNLSKPQPFELRVSLYPWIPDEDTFADWIESTFEKRNPDIDLVIRPMTISRDDSIDLDLSYDIDESVEALNFKDIADRQHLVEIDTMILSKLVDEQVIQPFEVSRSDYFNFAESAVTVNNTVYGVPHWTCGFFVMTTHQSVASANDAIELRDSLEALGTAYPDLGGYIEGSWNSVVVYLDAMLDSDPTLDPQDVVDDTKIDNAVLPYLQAFGDACTDENATYCNVYRKMEPVFANGELDALIGYSEALNGAIASNNPNFDISKVKIVPAPIGGGKSAFLFTDALVLSSKCVTDRCKNAARRFAEFYVSDEILSAAMLGFDSYMKLPRYLLPATRGALAVKQVAADPIYSQLVSIMDNALPYPNKGVPEAREANALRPLIKQLIHTPN